MKGLNNCFSDTICCSVPLADLPLSIYQHTLFCYIIVRTHVTYYTSHTSTIQCHNSSVGLWPKCISLLGWPVFLTKELLAFSYRRVYQNSFHPAQRGLLPFSVTLKHYHTHFTFCSTSQPLHPLNSADCTRKKQPSSQSIHCSSLCLLQAPSSVLKLHCTWFSSFADPLWYLSGLYTAYRLWISLPFKAPRVSERCVRSCQTFTVLLHTVGWKTIEVSCKNHLPPVIQLY